MDELLKKLGFDKETRCEANLTAQQRIAYENAIRNDIDRRFGRLTLIAYDPMHVSSQYCKAGSRITAQTNCLAKCECGNYVLVRHTDLVNMKKRSCGCWFDENRKDIAGDKYQYKHGDTGTRLYNIFWGMIRRCYNKNESSYPIYGGRGIKLCDEWYTPEDHSIGWLAFKEWAYRSGGYYDQPEDTPRRERLSIERIDGSENYCPDNCTFIPMYLQAQNLCTTRHVTLYGKTYTLREWANLCGIASTKMFDRRILNGWSEFDACTIPNRITRLANGIDTISNVESYTGPRYDSHGILRDSDGFITLGYIKEITK